MYSYLSLFLCNSLFLCLCTSISLFVTHTVFTTTLLAVTSSTLGAPLWRLYLGDSETRGRGREWIWRQNCISQHEIILRGSVTSKSFTSLSLNTPHWPALRRLGMITNFLTIQGRHVFQPHIIIYFANTPNLHFTYKRKSAYSLKHNLLRY